ncbi:putative Mg2+ transporter-C (MgtC) family protein [Humidesulfovibrio mexicanus]|uniref:Putative Mg2+ transporter-C (MgtC) family protein n=1 Tax=Humidesulfovibrio mexicanus TaxID=147047 RepID=A0A239CJ18_9BACT|nr:MgtC/SapB family protein [Humidesulfovibrio mexicanus]SNS19688.1 putative Mg2+ transporter-C (MgtC) family protein [Humidesulfovibrio mexicanus]
MTTDFLLRIALAGVLGALIGIERQLRAKEAGLRTHVLVCIGSAMFMIVSKYGFGDILAGEHIALDPSRVSAQVVSGVGFLGAGTILINKQVVKGLTTAAGLWVTASIGLVVGSGMYEIGVYGTVMTLIVLEVVRQLRDRLMGSRHFIELSVLPESVAEVFLALQKLHIRPGPLTISHCDGEATFCEMTLEVTLSARQKPAGIYQQLLTVKGLHKIEVR